MKNVAPRDTSELEALEQREWLESLDYVIQQGDRGRVQRLLAALRHRARTSRRGAAVHGGDGLRQHAPVRGRDAASRQPGDRAADQEPRALERDGDGRARQPRVRRHRRPHLDLRLGRHALRSRRSIISSAARTQDSDGDLVYFQGHASPGIYARAFLEGRLSVEKLQQLPPGARRGRRAVVVSASLADAGLLGVSDRLDGSRADHVDLPGPLQSLPRRSRA